jgi:UDP:flavonoid glycosyltransferase YjiC (YdhE family)
LLKVIADKKYKEAAERLKKRINDMDGKKISAEIIWSRNKRIIHISK